MRRFVSLLFLAGLVALFQPSAAHAQATPYLGQIMIVPYNFAPQGWLTCDGQVLPIRQYQALFALLGTTFGGDGVQTFALPDLRGRVPIGMGQGPGLSNYDLGGSGGQEEVTLTLAQIPSHTHVPMGTASVANTGSPSGAAWGTPRALLYSSMAPTVPMNGLAIGSTGGGQPHENRKPFVVMTYVIALEGVFPSRN
ncbi:MAG: tail fiber protein [Candidatus Acidiferrales bacterium]